MTVSKTTLTILVVITLSLTMGKHNFLKIKLYKIEWVFHGFKLKQTNLFYVKIL